MESKWKLIIKGIPYITILVHVCDKAVTINTSSADRISTENVQNLCKERGVGNDKK